MEVKGKRIGFVLTGSFCTFSKTIRKMKELKKQGKTMVFVTHSLGTVKDFCNRAVWLNNGVIKMDGNPDEVIDAYIKETT